MKFSSSALCGFLLAMPLATSTVFAQSATTSSKTQTGKTQTVGATAAKTPSEHGITALTPGAPAPPAHPITMEQTRDLLDLMNYKKIEDGNWSQMIAMNKQAAPFIPDDVWADVQTGVDGIDYSTVMQPIYAKYLSTEDAAKALAFYRTPEGKRVLQAMPQMLGESVAASQQKGRQVGRDAIEKHRAEIEAAQKKYQAEHAPATPAPSGAAGAPGATAAPGSASPSASPATPPSGSTTKPQK